MYRLLTSSLLLSCIILSIISYTSTSFSIIQHSTTSIVSLSSASNKNSNKALFYSVIGAEDEPDEPEIDPWSVKAAKPFQQAKIQSLNTPKIDKNKSNEQYSANTLKRYRDEYKEMETEYLNNDAYSNQVSGGIVPGYRLTSLCEDD